MIPRLFKPRAGRKEIGKSAERNVHASASENDFLTEPDFARTVSLEIRRAERSRNFLLVLLIDASRFTGTPKAHDTLRTLVSAVSLEIRETDICGWRSTGRIIGIAFTDIPAADRDSVQASVLARTTQYLERRMERDELDVIEISTFFLPEEWAAENGKSRKAWDRDSDLYGNVDERAAKRVVR